MHKYFEKNKFLILLLFVVFILRIPSLFEPYWYGDEGVYLTIGLMIKKGFLLYRDAYDNKPPLIYLLAALVNGSLFWFRSLLMVSVLASIAFFYKLVLNLFEKNEKPAKIATIVFSILTTLRLIEGNIANSEIFILLPTIAGFILFFNFKGEKDKLIKYLLLGLIFSIGFLYKIPAVFDFLVIMAFWLFYENKDKLISLGKKEIITGLGYFIPMVIIALFFFLMGSFGIFFKSVFIQTMGYLSSWKTGSHAFSPISLLKSELAIKAILVLIFMFILWLKKKAIDNKIIVLSLWFIFGLFGATLSGRPYAHYLIQIVPPLSIAIGMFFVKKNKLYLFAPITIIIILAASIFHYRFWVYTTPSYWLNFLKFTTGAVNKNTYYSYFDSKTPILYSIAETIDVYSQENDKIFIWGDEPSLYALSKRLPSTPYVAAYHIIDFNHSTEVASSLFKDKPKLIIVDTNIRVFTELEKIISKSYLKIQEEKNYMVYLKKI